MSDLQLTITNSPLNAQDPIEQTDAKINSRTIEQDNTNPAKRIRLEADDAWEYALDNPITERESSNQEVVQFIIDLQSTARNPEAKGRLIVQFPADILTQLFTYLDVKTIGSLLSLCQFGNTFIKNIFFTRANFVSNYLYGLPFVTMNKLSQSLTLTLLDASLESLKQHAFVAAAQAILDTIYTGLQTTDKKLTMEQIRECLDAGYFKDDEESFMRHVLTFDHPMYQREGKNIVQRFSDYHDYLLDLPNQTDEDNTESARRYGDSSTTYTDDMYFFPLRLIHNPEKIEQLVFCDMGLVTLSPQIADCVNLQELHVEQVNCLPSEIGQLTSLKSLTFQYHNLRSLPDSIVNLTKLTHLQFEADNLQDLIPFESLTPAQKEWLWTLKENGCTIELMDVPPRD
jgi:hypothetical protein